MEKNMFESSKLIVPSCGPFLEQKQSPFFQDSIIEANSSVLLFKKKLFQYQADRSSQGLEQQKTHHPSVLLLFQCWCSLQPQGSTISHHEPSVKKS